VGWVVKELASEETSLAAGKGPGTSPALQPNPPPLPPPPVSDEALDFASRSAAMVPNREAALLPGLLEETPLQSLGPLSNMDHTLGATMQPDSRAATTTPLSFGDTASTAVSTKGRAPRIGGNGKPGAFDAFVVYSANTDRQGRDSGARASAVTRGLQARGLAVCQQSYLARAVSRHLSSSDEAHFMAQAAQSSACAVVLLTRAFIDQVEAGAFGDSSVAAFTLAKRLPNAIVVAMEPELVVPTNWGWNRIFARLSGRAVVDLSMESSALGWEESVDRLAWLLDPSVNISRLLSATGASSYSSSTRAGPQLPVWPTSPSAPATLPASSVATNDAANGLCDGRSYHCFISHNWGKDSQGRDNHLRVLQIARALQKHGVEVFVDDWEAHRYDSVDEAIVDGMRRSSVALVFITRAYIDKIEESTIEDDCVAQFNLAKRAPGIIPVIMEPELMQPSRWGWNRVYAHLSGKKLVDLSRGEVSGLPGILWNAGSQRMHSALDLLEMRIRCEAARLPPSFVQRRPPPLAPMRDTVLAASACLASAALLQVIVAFGRIVLGCGGAAPRNWLLVLAAASGLCWMVGFVFFVAWLLMKARVPPRFEINPGMMQPASVLAGILRAIAGLLFAAKPVLELLEGTLQLDLPWIEIAGTHTFLAGSMIGLLDSLVLSRGLQGNFQVGLPVTVSDLPGWGSAALAAGSILVSVAAQWRQEEAATALNPQKLCDLEVIGSLLLLAGSLCYLGWVVLNPWQLRRYFEKFAIELGVASPKDVRQHAGDLRQAARTIGSEAETKPQAALETA